MNRIITILFCLFVGLPYLGYGQCSGRYDFSYPSVPTATNPSGITTTTTNNGSGNISTVYCPTPGGTQTLTVLPYSNSTLTLLNNGVQVGSSVAAIAGTTYSFTLAATSQSATYTLRSEIACNNPKPADFILSLSPTLAITTTSATACTDSNGNGSNVTLTATGSNSGSYTWSAPGFTTVTNTGTLTVAPTTTTTYTVTAPTACGTSTQQQITIFVPVLTATSSASTVCPSTSVTLTAASNVAGATFSWTATTSTGTTSAGSGSTISVTPATSTTYRVTSSQSGGCLSAAYKDLTVTVASQTLSVSPPAPSVFRGNSVTLTATSNISGASFTWRTGGSAGPVVATGPSYTTTPQSTTTYTVTSVAGTCSSTQNVTVTVLIPLPVALTAFEVRQTDGGALLTWTTGSEVDNAYFVVERSRDSRVFEAVSKLAGIGSTDAPADYRYLDTQAQLRSGSTVYYRLRQVDQSGLVHYSPVKALRYGASEARLTATVYPNPFDKSDKAPTLRLSAPSAGPVICTVHDVLGRVLFTYSIAAAEGVQTLPLPAAATPRAGLYYLRVRQGDQQQVVRLQQR